MWGKEITNRPARWVQASPQMLVEFRLGAIDMAAETQEVVATVIHVPVKLMDRQKTLSMAFAQTKICGTLSMLTQAALLSTLAMTVIPSKESPNVAGKKMLLHHLNASLHKERGLFGGEGRKHISAIATQDCLSYAEKRILRGALREAVEQMLIVCDSERDNLDRRSDLPRNFTPRV